MRYVNLKKRRTSKVAYLSKKALIACFLFLGLGTIISIPLNNDSNLEAQNYENIVEVVDEIDVVVNDANASF